MNLMSLEKNFMRFVEGDEGPHLKIMNNSSNVKEAKSNGGVWYETEPDFFSNLTQGLSDTDARKKDWSVNEQFLQSQLESGMGRIDLHGESVAEVLMNRPNSFTAMEIKFLENNEKNYGYVREGNSWIKVK